MTGIIRHLGHAGFAVEHQEIKLLIDPWFYSAFFGSWFPYPDNRFLLSQIVAKKFDYLYISHAHEDHYDKLFLADLDRSITVIAPKFRSNAIVRRVRDLGFANLIVLDHQEPHYLTSCFSVTMYLDTSHKEDSGILVDMDGFRFLDLNDCNPPISELPRGVDLLAAQFSGAMWYPNCYDYLPCTMQNKVEVVRRGLIDTLCRKVKMTGAKAYIPSAGPPCFLDPILEKYNDRDHTIFAHWEDVAGDFAKRCPNVSVLRTSPGDRIRVEASMPVVERVRDARTKHNLIEYRERRRAEWSEFHRGAATPITSGEVATHFRTLQRRNRHLLENFHKEIRLCSGGKAWRIQLGDIGGDFVTEGGDPFAEEYTLTVPPRILRAVIKGATGWEEALLSMRLNLHRDPDVFDAKLMSLLRYGNAPVATLKLMRDQTVIEMIERDGLRLQRFCPHAGEDLVHASIHDGVIECPRHHWCWDARTGECLAGGNLKLKVEVLRPIERPI
jgi:UDP-MurNAc hydroxylase